MTTTQKQYHETPAEVKLVLSSLWIAMLIVFAYVDIFGFYRADVLKAALNGKIAGVGFTVDQVFLTSTLAYILLPTLMVVFSLLLKPRANRIANIAVSALYVVTIGASCIGETWVYYLLGSLIEVILLLAIARTAWRWPTSNSRGDDAAAQSSGAAHPSRAGGRIRS